MHIITARVNIIMKNRLDFANNYSILLTLYYRHIDLKIKDIDVIILALDNIELCLIYTNLMLHCRQWLTQMYISYK